MHLELKLQFVSSVTTSSPLKGCKILKISSVFSSKYKVAIIYLHFPDAVGFSERIPACLNPFPVQPWTSRLSALPCGGPEEVYEYIKSSIFISFSLINKHGLLWNCKSVNMEVVVDCLFSKQMNKKKEAVFSIREVLDKILCRSWWLETDSVRESHSHEVMWIGPLLQVVSLWRWNPTFTWF